MGWAHVGESTLTWMALSWMALVLPIVVPSMWGVVLLGVVMLPALARLVSRVVLVIALGPFWDPILRDLDCGSLP